MGTPWIAYLEWLLKVHSKINAMLEQLDADPLFVVLTTLAVTIAIFLFKRSSSRSGNESGKRFPPSLPSLPIVGSLPYVSGGMDVLPEFFMKTAEKLGPVFIFNTGSRLTVVLNGKEAISDAMMRHGEAFADKPGLWTEATCLNKGLRGLAFAHYTELFKKYHKQSLICLKELGFGANRVTEERIHLAATDLYDEFRMHKGRPFDPKIFIMHTVSSIVISVLFGRRFVTTGDGYRNIIGTAKEFVENLDQSIDMAPLLRFLPMYRKKIANMERCQDGIMKGLEEGVELNKLPDGEPSYVRRFLEDQGPGYDHKDLLFILRDMCLGGSDTVSATMLWFITELANHQDVQSRMRQEIDREISGGRYPSMDDKAQLPYSEAAILEVMRRHTVVPLALPHATLKDTTTSGYFVPRGSLVMVNVYGMSMDPKTWEDPENFRPERFLDEDNKVVGRDRIIPFGIGRRVCVAENLGRQEVFLLLTSLVQHFEVLPPEGQDFIKVKDVCGLTVNPSNYEVRLIPRSKDWLRER